MNATPIERKHMTSPPMDDPEEILAYHARRREIRTRVKRLGHGAQFKATLALEISASLISSVLSGKYIDRVVLGRIEEWLVEQESRPEV